MVLGYVFGFMVLVSAYEAAARPKAGRFLLFSQIDVRERRKAEVMDRLVWFIHLLGFGCSFFGSW